MFSGLSKLIFGDTDSLGKPECSRDSSTTPSVDEHAPFQSLREQEEDDWVVLCNMENEPAVESLKIDTAVPGIVTSDDPGSVTPGLSTPPTPMEGSWTLAPPPCFVSNSDSTPTPEYSPMENLLIEHPSMSVYIPLQKTTERINTKRSTSRCKKHATPSNTPSTDSSKSKKIVKRKPCRTTQSAGSAANRLKATQIQVQNQLRSHHVESQKFEKRKAELLLKQSTKPLSNRVLTIRDRNNNSPAPTYSQCRRSCRRHT